MEIIHTLEHLTISSFARQSRRPVVRLGTTSCVKEALMTFNSERILSCPVASSSHGADVCGFLDVFDLLSYLLDLWDENQMSEKDCIRQLGETFLNHTVADLTDRSDNDVYAAVIAGEPADKIVRLFGLGVHRVAMMDLQGNITNIISQSDVVKYMDANIDLLGECADKTIQELNIASTDKLVVAESVQSVISAFKLLASNLVSAVPIVDKQGTLAGTLSVSDLKLLKDDLSPLLLPTSQYKSKQETIPDIVCTMATPLRSVISMLASTGVHRVWVVDEQRKPTSVISITNVCEFLSRFFPQEASADDEE